MKLNLSSGREVDFDVEALIGAIIIVLGKEQTSEIVRVAEEIQASNDLEKTPLIHRVGKGVTA